jgi:hypothetical protein
MSSFKKYKIVLLCFTVILLFFLYLYNIKYSISEINADNFEEKLNIIDASILIDNGLDSYIPDQIPIAMGYEFQESNDFRGNGLKIINKKIPKGNEIEIYSSFTGIDYWFIYANKSLIYASIFKDGLLDQTKPNTILIKKIIDNMIIKDEFILKRTERKKGSDILIKETEKSFIIVKFSSYDDEIPPQQILILSFSKNKYLNFLHF